MDVREKLVEIIQNSVGGCARHWAEVIADGLIAHGVTVQEWISVKDRLPANRDLVLACSMDLVTKKQKIYLARFDGKYWVGDETYVFGRVTHWQYLPQQPKGE